VVSNYLNYDSHNLNVLLTACFFFSVPLGPRACYDEGKRVAETLSYAYAKQEKVDVRVARIFNTFGPRMHMNDGRVVSNFILQALKNEPITVRTF
jgi:UDP-glucuronate decarboxylase